jgi:hypothetical protein
MTSAANRVLFWAPRVLTIVFAIFVAAFALDVFGEGYSGWRLLLALIIHLVPAAIIAAVLALAWRWEWVGTLLFAGLGLFYLRYNLRHPNWILVISGPMFVIAALFLINWVNRSQLHPKRADQ